MRYWLVAITLGTLIAIVAYNLVMLAVIYQEVIK